MITNQILEDKWRVQKALSQEAGHDSAKYVALVHERALETQKRYGLRLRYAEMADKTAAGSQDDEHA